MENVPFTINKKQQNYEGNGDLVLDQKLDLITAGAKPFLKDHLLTKISRENCSIIVDYILSMLHQHLA